MGKACETVPSCLAFYVAISISVVLRHVCAKCGKLDGLRGLGRIDDTNICTGRIDYLKTIMVVTLILCQLTFLLCMAYLLHTCALGLELDTPGQTAGARHQTSNHLNMMGSNHLGKIYNRGYTHKRTNARTHTHTHLPQTRPQSLPRWFQGPLQLSAPPRSLSFLGHAWPIGPAGPRHGSRRSVCCWCKCGANVKC